MMNKPQNIKLALSLLLALSLGEVSRAQAPAPNQQSAPPAPAVPAPPAAPAPPATAEADTSSDAMTSGTGPMDAGRTGTGGSSLPTETGAGGGTASGSTLPSSQFGNPSPTATPGSDPGMIISPEGVPPTATPQGDGTDTGM